MCRRLVLLVLIALLAGCNLTQSDNITPIPTPDLPVVQILAPENNRQVFEGTEFDIDILAEDNNPGIGRVELFVDGESLNTRSPEGEISVPRFRVLMNWRAIGEGLHLIEAVAYRPDGTQGDVAAITIEVLPRD